MSAVLTNLYSSQTRRLSAHIDILLAGGAFIPNWRAGWTNVDGGDSFTTTWNQALPAINNLVGTNHFTLVAEDVTVAPFNQPPYPPAGSTDTASCMVTGVAP